MTKNKNNQKAQQWTYVQQQNFLGSAFGFMLAGVISFSIIAMIFFP